MDPQSSRWNAGRRILALTFSSLLLGAGLLGVIRLVGRFPLGAAAPGGARAEATSAPAPTAEGSRAAAVDSLPRIAVGQGSSPATAEPARNVPRDVVIDFLDACRASDYHRAAAHLDLRRLNTAAREIDGPRLARELKVVLDQKLWIEPDLISDQAAGNLDDGLPPEFERVGSIATDRGSVDILLENVGHDPGDRHWRFAASTVARIPQLYGQFGNGLLERLLPAPLRQIRFLEAELWQWIGLVLVVIVAFGLAWMIVTIVHRTLRPLVHRTALTFDDALLDLVIGPLRLVVWVGLFAFGAVFLNLSVPVQNFLGGVQTVIVSLAVTWLVLRGVDIGSSVLEERFRAKGMTPAISALPLGRRALKVVIASLALLAMLQNLGVQVTALVASLGVGGLALALAAQKTVENLFGGVSVIMDQPVRVGDFCKFGETVGTVEDIGLRSTRVRTLDRTVISIPNADFAAQQIENFGRRDRIRLALTLGLLYQTTPDQLRWVLVQLKQLLLSHPRVLPDPARVRFVGLGASALNVEVFAYIDTADFNEFAAIREDILLRILDVVAASGTGFAYPTQTLLLGRDAGTDAELSRAAEQQVSALRAQNQLPLPDVPPHQAKAVSGTLEYPPPGSAQHMAGLPAAPPDRSD